MTGKQWINIFARVTIKHVRSLQEMYGEHIKNLSIRETSSYLLWFTPHYNVVSTLLASYKLRAEVHQ